MAGRLDLLDRVRGILAQAGFAVSERVAIRPVSFDVVARRDDRLLIVKVLTNIDSFDGRVAREMLTLARFMEGTALLVGQRAGGGDLEGGVVYLHHGIRALTIETLAEHLLGNQPPLVFAAPGGMYVELDPEALRRVRRERALSLGTLAGIAGVSRRTIQMYEQGMRATIESAIRLEESLEVPLVAEIDPLEHHADPPPEAEEPDWLSQLERDVFGLLETVGYQVVPTGKSPFAALSHQDPDLILTGINEDEPRAQRKARIMASISQVTERDGVFVFRKETVRKDIEGTAVVTRKELRKIREPEELRRLIEDRRPRRPG